MGIIILTADDSPYRSGNVIESRGLKHPPTAPDTTYLVHVGKITEKEILRWVDVVTYRLVFVINKLPKLKKETKEEIIIDKSLNTKSGHKKEIDALFRWGDRRRVHTLFAGTPLPLALAFVRVNDKRIELWRTLAKVTFTLPPEYAEAVLVYGIKPTNKSVAWPNKSKKDDEAPPQFRNSDKYWRNIIAIQPKVRNQIRTQTPDKAPEIMKKRMEKTHEWF